MLARQAEKTEDFIHSLEKRGKVKKGGGGGGGRGRDP